MLQKQKAKKCFTCPYANGQIKCIQDPCLACMASKRRTHPFDFPVTIKRKGEDKSKKFPEND